MFSPSSSVFRYVGVAPGPWTVNKLYYANKGSQVPNMGVVFRTTAPRIDLSMIEFNTDFEVRVDGQPVQSSQFRFASTGAARVVQLQFADAGSRKIEVFGRLMPFGGVWVGQGYSVSYPSEDDAVPLIAFAPGDSYTQGTGAASPRRTYAGVAADALGYDFWSEGVGGAGWLVSPGEETASVRVQKYTARLSKQPSVIVTAMGFNDAGGDLTMVAANYDAAVAAMKTAWPAARIVTLGPWTPAGASEPLTAVRQLLQDRAAADGVTFIDVEGIITADNAPQYIGADLTHPTADGHVYLGQQIAARLKAAGF